MNGEITNFFVHRTAAQRYAAARPYFHPRVIEIIAAYIGARRTMKFGGTIWYLQRADA
jgi:hypothetical protein